MKKALRIASDAGLVNQPQYEQETNNLRYTFILILSLIMIASCENSEEEISKFIDIENSAVEQLIKAEIIYTENGYKKVKIKSNIMERFFDKEERIELSGNVQFDFYKLNSSSKNSALTSVLTCDRATINHKTNIMIAKGDVNIKIGDTTLSTQQLIWEKNRKARYFDENHPVDNPPKPLTKYDNVDLIYSDYKVEKIYKGDTTSFATFRCTSDFGASRVINGKTFKSPMVFTKFRSDSIGSATLKKN